MSWSWPSPDVASVSIAATTSTGDRWLVGSEPGRASELRFFRAAKAPARVLKQEEPFCCIRCSKPFGVQSTIERVAAKLEGKHWMYAGASRRLDIIRMCDDCRVAAVAEEGFDPYGPQSQVLRTTDDYLREREILKRTGLEG